MLDAMEVTHNDSIGRETKRKVNESRRGKATSPHRHPGAGRDPERLGAIHAQESWAPAFAGVTVKTFSLDSSCTERI